MITRTRETAVRASRFARLAAYAWAGPNTLLGLIAGLVVLALGGQVRAVSGVLEFSGGRMGALAASLPRSVSFGAITFGHVILGTSAAELDAVRRHEHVHVAQYEVWGPSFLPAYLGSSAWQLVRGRHVYLDNFFEKQAYASTVANECSPTPG